MFNVYVAYNNAIFILFLQQSSFSEISSLEDILYTSCRSRDKTNNREMGHLVSLSPSSWCILVVHHVRIVSMCYHLTSQRWHACIDHHTGTQCPVATCWNNSAVESARVYPIPVAFRSSVLSFFFLSLFSSSYLTVLVTIKLWYWFTELLRFILRGTF